MMVIRDRKKRRMLNKTSKKVIEDWDRGYDADESRIDDSDSSSSDGSGDESKRREENKCYDADESRATQEDEEEAEDDQNPPELEDDHNDDESEEDGSEEEDGDDDEYDDDEEYDDEEEEEEEEYEAEEIEEADEVEEEERPGQQQRNFGDVLSGILQANVPPNEDSTPRSTPILAGTKAEAVLSEQRFRQRVQKEISRQKSLLANKEHVKPDFSTINYEKRLVKIARRGVVKLFNAISKQQKVLAEEIKTQTNPDKIPKEKFLSLLKKAEGDSVTSSSSSGGRSVSSNPVPVSSNPSGGGIRKRKAGDMFTEDSSWVLKAGDEDQEEEEREIEWEEEEMEFE